MKKVFISGEIIIVSYDLVQSLKSLIKPTILYIKNQIPDHIDENILILMLVKSLLLIKINPKNNINNRKSCTIKI